MKGNMITRCKTKSTKNRLIFSISGKSAERIFKRMLKELNMNVLIKRGDKVEKEIVYPITNINIKKNTITFQNGDVEETVSIVNVVAINIKSTNPTMVITKKGEDYVS